MAKRFGLLLMKLAIFLRNSSQHLSILAHAACAANAAE